VWWDEADKSRIIYLDIDGRFFNCSFRMSLIYWSSVVLFFLLLRQTEKRWMRWMPMRKLFSTLQVSFIADDRSTLQFDEDIEEIAGSRPILDAIEHIIDAREWDVPYHIRVAIDKGML
jgi:hypothetical protein